MPDDLRRPLPTAHGVAQITCIQVYDTVELVCCLDINHERRQQLLDRKDIAMTRNDVFHELERLMEIDEGSLKGDENLKNFSQWDSLLVMGYIALIQNKLGIVLGGQNVAKAKTIGDLVALVSNKLDG
jgi:acyl carrier protein